MTNRYKLLDCINRSAIDNADWGLCHDISTQPHFRSVENIKLKGEYLYLYRYEGDNFCNWGYELPEPTYHLSIPESMTQWIDLYKL